MIGVSDWLDRSTSLLPALRDAGLQTGIGEQLKVLQLLQLLGERGAAPKDPEELTRWVAPVLCTRSDQTIRLQTILKQYFASGATSQDRTSPSVVAPTPRSMIGWIWLFGAAIVLGALIVGIAKFGPTLLFQAIPAARKVIDLSTSAYGLTEREVVAVFIVLIIGLSTFGLLIYRRINLALHSGRAIGPETLRSVALDPPAADVDNPDLLRAARVLNRPSLTTTRRLDVSATIRATAEAGGRFLPVRGFRRLAANWMLLVERSGAQDPLPAFGARLSLLLDRSGVRHSLYEFRRSPDWVREGGPRGAHTPLERALGKARPTRLLMMSEAARTIDPRNGGPARWLTDNDVPRDVVLLTPKARDLWSSAEAQAAQAGILVLPGDANGISTLARRIQAEELTPEPIAPARESQFDLWQEQRFIWLSRTRPADDARQSLTDALKQLLTAEEFRLLVGIAAFPKVHLELMSTLDKHLYPASQPSAQRDRLLKLGRLVWIKEGFIPEWLREDLLRALQRADRDDVRVLRDIWTTMLKHEPEPGDKRTTLKIHSEGSTAAGVAADELFIGFLNGKFDLPAPLHWAGLSTLLRAPDRIDWLIVGTGLALMTEVLAAGVDLFQWTQSALLRWADLMRLIVTDLQSFIAVELLRPLAISPLALAIAWLATSGIRQILPFRLSRILAVIGALLTLAFGWLGAIPTRGLDYTPSPADPWVAFFAPPIIAIAVALLFTIRQRTNQEYADLGTILQKTRGTGLQDWPTNVVLFLIAGLAALVLDSQASLWLALIPALGVVRAIVLSFCGAQLQPSFPLERVPFGQAMAGLAIGEIVSAMLFRYLQIGMWATNALPTGSFVPAYLPYLSFGPILLGGMFGCLVMLWQQKLLSMRRVMFYSAIVAPIALALPLSTHSYVFWLTTDSTQDSLPILARFIYPLHNSAGIEFYVAVLIVTSLIALAVVGSALAQHRPRDWGIYLSALLTIASTGALIVLLRNIGTIDDSFVLLCSTATLSAIWPLIQRIFTSEPSILDQSTQWRARTVAPRLWVIAPVVFATTLLIPAGVFVLDFSYLVLPLAIWFGWHFGLRGWRTTALMILPAFWPIAPNWLSPPSTDLAASALILSALFARPRMLTQILSTSSLPSLAVALVAATLSIQVHLSSAGSLALSTSPAAELIRPEAQTSKQFINSANAKRDSQSSATPAPRLIPKYTAGVVWEPSSLLILILFLTGLSGLVRQGLFIALPILIAGGVAFAFKSKTEYVGLISPLGAFAGLLAYRLGQYSKQRLVAQAASLTSVTSTATTWLTPSALLVAGMGAILFSLSILIPDHDGSSTSILALGTLLTWGAGVSFAQNHTGFRVGIVCLVALPFLVSLNASLIPAGGPVPKILYLPNQSVSVLALFLPAIFFGLGGQCRDFLLRAVADLPPETKVPTVAVSENDVAAQRNAEAAEAQVSWRKSPDSSGFASTEAIGSRKRIVILIDGPGMGYGQSASNVLKMYRCLQGEIESLHQTVFYISGVAGSAASDFNPWNRLRNSIQGVLGLATGYSFDEDVLKAYEFLVENYREGDEIYLFGFGRGAYAARVTAGFVHKVGLIAPQQLSFARSGLTAYKRSSAGQRTEFSETEDDATQFAKAFSARRPTIRFVGVWDTVAPAIIPRSDRLFFPSLEELAFTIANPSVRTFRQAISIDERRALFRVTPWLEPQRFIGSGHGSSRNEMQDSLQMWFAGVHADVGGGYPEDESGLSKFSLIWMVEEAARCGLSINQSVFREVAWGVRSSQTATNYAVPAFVGPMHNSLTSSWWLLEFLPKSARFKEWPARKSFLGFYIPGGEPRLIPEGAVIHESVIKRMEALANYSPINLPRTYQVEPIPAMVDDLLPIKS